MDLARFLPSQPSTHFPQNAMLSKAIKEQIFSLPEHEKRHLIEEIWDSMEAIHSIPEHHERILKERLESYEADASNAVTLEEFERRLRKTKK
jgi:putative addiction module component (TIGR02574 family)